MSRKSISFFMPFSVSFAASLVLGLAVLYFGVYRPRISAGMALIASTSPTLPNAGQRAFETDESGVQRGTPVETPVAKERAGRHSRDHIGGTQTPVDKNIQKPSNGKNNKTAAGSGNGRPDSSLPGSPAINSARTSTRSGDARKTGSGATGASTSSNDGGDVKRGPAYPDSIPDDSVTADAIPAAPSMDDAAKDENPLIRALKSASQKKKDSGETESETPVHKNPFDFILNKDKQNSKE